MIELRNVSRYFDKTKAVDDVSFSVRAGEVFGYVGPNGAGKTTSMRILATLDVPTAGDAFVDGFSVIDDPDRVRRRLGFMPDDFNTYPNMNVREYLDFFARAYQIDRHKRPDAIEKVMTFTGLDVLAEKPIDGLSKGMRQRLGLGRALIHDPAVLVLDEPAAGLDPRARIELREMIVALARRGKAILISSHILTELAEMCQSVAIIERGRLLAVGTVAEIQRGLATPQKTIGTACLDPLDRLAAWLSGRDHVTAVVVKEDEVQFQYAGALEEEAALLRAMIEGGFRVVRFAARRHSLEDVFMQVTKGAVQ